MRVGAAKRVNIQPPTPGVKGLEMQEIRLIALKYIAEHTLDTLFMEFLMLAVGNDVLQQGMVLDGRAPVMYPHACPVGLPRDGAK